MVLSMVRQVPARLRRAAPLFFSRTLPLALSLSLLWCGACHAAPLQPYRLVAGELPPFATESDPRGQGALVEIVQELARRLGTPPKVEFYPWQRALMMTANLHHIAVLPLTRTPERESQYRWLAHLYMQRFVFVARHGSVNVNDLDELRKRRVAVLRGSLHLEALTEQKFQHLIECATASECMRMVATGLADASYGSEAVRRSALNLGHGKEADFDYSLPFRAGEIWLAGSLDFSDAEAASWRGAMAAMRADGSAARILRKYGLDPDLDKP
ncbi:ABC transporter substrate-binding protein [Rugamonas sp.]|uniref:substrate-binding periplasmic protein n=1 Tax=Rugamonas sp. TaxID=1926287 RepID=UPI0025F8508E|nr:transporter substrate-binding domain-containing protein [Rugamonas sp.]